jgi:hypothetical protein
MGYNANGGIYDQAINEEIGNGIYTPNDQGAFANQVNNAVFDKQSPGGEFEDPNTAQMSVAASRAEIAARIAIDAQEAAVAAQVAAEAAQAAAEEALANIGDSVSQSEAAALAAAASAAAALASKTAAELAEANAELAEANAELAQTAAQNYSTSASTSASNASTSATSANNSAIAAANSATSASTSASTATTKASQASVSASNASTSASSANSSATSAATSAANADISEENAATSATNAASSASSASTSATNASNSASSALSSANTATTKANEASASASSAATSASSASASADAALAALDNFDDRYLGQKATAPTVDNDGNPLITGALYFNTTTNEMKVWDGSQWLNAYASLSNALLKNNNLSDLDSVSTARTNLGLGTAATTNASAYATAAQGTKADTAYSWGNHASAGYLTSETDPIYTASSWYTTTNNSTNWNTAYSWGNHASAGYALSSSLGTAAYTASTAYATAAQGAKADTAIQTITSSDASLLITPTGTSIDVIVSADSPASTLVASVRNETGATLTKGTIVYSGGAAGNKMLVYKALATSDATSAQTFGMITADIPNNQNGYATISGVVSGLNTSGLIEGGILYLSPTVAGQYTQTKPSAPNHLVYVGIVTRVHQNQGSIQTRIQNGYELDEIHDVAISGVAENHFLVRNGVNLWVNKTPTQARTSLGLGTAATTDSSAYATAAQGAKADTALQSYTETDPIYTASSWYSTTNNSSSWNTAYGWGNHASAGYLTQTVADGLYASINSVGDPAGTAVAMAIALG